MITSNLPILNIHQLSEQQFQRIIENDEYDENALYLTPDNLPSIFTITFTITYESSGETQITKVTSNKSIYDVITAMQNNAIVIGKWSNESANTLNQVMGCSCDNGDGMPFAQIGPFEWNLNDSDDDYTWIMNQEG